MIPFRVYSDKTVLEAAKERIAWLFDEFPNVVTTTSGGKDSVVNFHLALEVARAKNRLPLNVMFLDQEIEWQASIDVIRAKMEHPDVKPFWMQIPFQLSNSTSASEEWLYCWEPKKKHLWMREQESCSYKENTFKKVRFNELLSEIPRYLFNGEPVAILGGVRCEESPSRTLGLTSRAVWKWATWGQASRAKYGVRTFYPLYDWHTSDVWKAIHDHGWQYNRIYDAYYQYGMGIKDMRISNFHHETSVKNMFVVQECEPDTYNRAVARLAGLDCAAKLGTADYFPKQLPYMFRSWREYRDYLLEKLIAKEDWRKIMAKRFAKDDEVLFSMLGDKLHQMHVASVVVNDWEGVKSRNMSATAGVRKYAYFTHQKQVARGLQSERKQDRVPEHGAPMDARAESASAHAG